MNLTTLGDRKTPTAPVQISFGPNTGLANPLKTLVLIGHRGAGAASGASGVLNNVPLQMANVASVSAASGEIAGYAGSGSELAKMVIAAVTVIVGAGGNIPPIYVIPLANGDTDWGGGTNACLANLDKLAGICGVASPYDGTSATNRDSLLTEITAMSGPERTENQQFGSFGFFANQSTATPASLPQKDMQYFVGAWLRDTSGSSPRVVGEISAMVAALWATNGYPFNPQDNTVVPGLAAPTKTTDWITVGAGLESESCLGQGWIPLRVTPSDGLVRVVRTVTGRLTIDGSVAATAYYDVQDFDALYYFRKVVYTRFKQPDFTNVKATKQKAEDMLSEMVRLAKQFETDGVFQAVDKLAKLFQVARRATDRSTFEAFVPVNVVPGLHSILSNIQASTQFDSFTV